MKTTEILELSIKEIVERLDNEQTLLVKQKLNHAISPLDNPLTIKETRRNIARLKTVLHQKKLDEQKS